MLSLYANLLLPAHASVVMVEEEEEEEGKVRPEGDVLEWTGGGKA